MDGGVASKLKKAFAFFPHAFATKVTLGRLPRIKVSRKAYAQMWHLVDMADLEVAWLGVVIQKANTYLIDEIFIFDQIVSGASAALDPAGVASVAEKLLMSNDPDNLRKVNSLFLWGHSHVRMGTSPSGQDENQLEEFGQNQGVEYMIRLIANKNGRLEFTFRDFKRGLKIIDLPWSAELIDKTERQAIQTEFTAKVHAGGFVTGSPPYYGDNSHLRDDYPSDYGDGFDLVIEAGRRVVEGVKNFLNPPNDQSATKKDEPEELVSWKKGKPWKPPKRGG